MKRYRGEAVDSERRGTSSDELVTVAPTRGTTSTDTSELGEPEEQAGASLSYHRGPIGTGLTVAPQAPSIGSEVKQAGAGRAHLPPSITLPPDQSVTPEPDHRRIARPMPSAPWDAGMVVNPSAIGGESDG